MAKFYLRVITDCEVQTADQLISDFLSTLPGIIEFHTEPVKPYWKNPGQSELSVRIDSVLSMEQIQTLLADQWDGEAANSRQSRIHVPFAAFLWLSC